MNVGRVMPPTLGMVVQREAAIDAFVARPFYTVQIRLSYGTASSRRYENRAEAEAVRRVCEEGGRVWVAGMVYQEKTQKPPALYDLTTLQRDANRLLGFTAQQTLDYVQNLYEKKLVTYPRTDSRYLTDDMEAAVPELVQGTATAFGMPENIPVQAAQVVNGKKVSDHHAIIPTRSMAAYALDMLPAGEMRALRLIAARFLAAVGEACRVVELECVGTVFTMKGRTALQEGWKEIERKMRAAGPGTEAEDFSGADESPAIGESSETEEFAEFILPNWNEGEMLESVGAILKEGRTSPPRHFKEDFLLQSMENAGEGECPENSQLYA